MNSERTVTDNQIKHFYEFGPFRLDPREKLLLRNGERIPLTLKAFDTLLILVERHGHIVEKTELIQRIWPDSIVEENNLTQNVSAIRKALSANGHDQHFIETLPRRGYRFIGEVREQSGEETSKTEALVELETSPPLSPSSIKQPMRSRAKVFFLSSLFLAMVASIVYLTRVKTPGPVLQNQNIKINRLAGTNDAWEAAISPDGTLVAYIVGDAGRQSLRLKQLETSTDNELLTNEELRFRGLAFALDGRSVYYAQQQKTSSEYVLYQKPIQGGEARRLLTGVDSTVTFSPNGRYLAFVRESETKGESSLVIASINGTGERVVSTRKMPHYYAVEGLSWSPDGKMLAVAAATTAPKFHFQLLTINVDNGQETSIGPTQWEWAGKTTWINDSRLAMIGRKSGSGTNNNQLWLIDYPSGQYHKLLTDLNDYRALSVRQDGKAIVTVRSETRADLWVVPETNTTKARPITTDGASQAGTDGLDWTLDNRIVYTSLASESKNLWLIHANGTQARPLTTEIEDNAANPSVTANGQHVVFNSGRAGFARIWRIDIDGKSPLELSHGNLDLNPSSSPIEDWVYFSQRLAAKRIIYRVRIDGTLPPQALTDKPTDYPVVSPDGKQVACFYQETPKSPRQVAIIPALGEAATQKLDIAVFPASSLKWHPTNKALTYLTKEDGATNIWQQRLDGGPPEKLTDFKADRIFAYAWSRDGRTLACSRGTINRDVIMISDFK